MKLEQLIVYRELTNDENILKCLSFCIDKNDNQEEFISCMISLAEKYDLHGHLFQSLITYLLVHHENVFTLSLERKKHITPSLKKIIMSDLKIIFSLFHYDFSYLYSLYKDIFFNFPYTKPIINKEIYELLLNLQEQLSNTQTVEEFYEILLQHYTQYGVGKYGLNKAFRFYEGNIISIDHIGNNTLDQLIGYEKQKERLKNNTEAFIQGKKANNVLLYGDSGTGKSSSIKALLNEYYKDGLRMVEVYKHQFIYLPQIINELQNRNYKFVIFMDDLSFEDFEIEYKYLKAVIEGGLEKKPDNVLIYATSNRRHLVREKFSDKADRDDELHTSDTVQEKLSLVARFGVTIYFGKPDKKEFQDIVKNLAKRHQIQMGEEELLAEANKWELSHGGLSGRTAQQFINYLLGKQ